MSYIQDSSPKCTSGTKYSSISDGCLRGPGGDEGRETLLEPPEADLDAQFEAEIREDLAEYRQRMVYFRAFEQAFQYASEEIEFSLCMLPDMVEGMSDVDAQFEAEIREDLAEYTARTVRFEALKKAWISCRA